MLNRNEELQRLSQHSCPNEIAYIIIRNFHKVIKDEVKVKRIMLNKTNENYRDNSKWHVLKENMKSDESILEVINFAGKLTTSPEQLANKFAHHFLKKVDD